MLLDEVETIQSLSAYNSELRRDDTRCLILAGWSQRSFGFGLAEHIPALCQSNQRFHKAVHFLDSVFQSRDVARIRGALMFHKRAKFEAGKIHHRELVYDLVRQCRQVTLLAFLSAPSVAAKMGPQGGRANAAFFHRDFLYGVTGTVKLSQGAGAMASKGV